MANLLGSVAFQVSALYGFVGPEPAAASARFWAGFTTAVGGLCFLVGSYLMLPELFDEEPEIDASAAAGSRPRETCC